MLKRIAIGIAAAVALAAVAVLAWFCLIAIGFMYPPRVSPSEGYNAYHAVVDRVHRGQSRNDVLSIATAARRVYGAVRLTPKGTVDWLTGPAMDAHDVAIINSSSLIGIYLIGPTLIVTFDRSGKVSKTRVADYDGRYDCLGGACPCPAPCDSPTAKE